METVKPEGLRVGQKIKAVENDWGGVIHSLDIDQKMGWVVVFFESDPVIGYPIRPGKEFIVS